MTAERPPGGIRVVVADDHSVVRAGLRSLLSRQQGIEVVGEAASAPEMLEVVRRTAPDVVLVDLKMPGGGTIEAIRTLQAVAPAPRVMVFTAYDDPADVLVSFRSGARAFALKSSSETALPDIVRRVMAGERFVDPAVGPGVVQEVLREIDAMSAGPAAPLSDREKQVLHLIAAGYMNKEIAARLRLGVKSVETYRQRLMSKLHLKTRAELTRYALHMGISEPDARSGTPKKGD